MKRLSCLLLCLLSLAGCTPKAQKKQYTATYLDVFDTVTTITGLANSKEEFEAAAGQIHENLLRYHRLFDIYNVYDGLNNLKTVNDSAGIAPVQVGEEILALAKDCKEYHTLTNGLVNAAMGSVLKLWHDARTDSIADPLNAYLPDERELTDAAAHTDMEKLVIDEANSTVFLADEKLRLDVGAIAKGWATQRIAENAPAGLLISVGGNVCATGPKAEDTPWVVGINHPDGGEQYLHTLYVTDGCVVTSGDYQRYFVVDGKPYHHIIHPDTLMPSSYWRSVTVVCKDSGLADALSTALFLLPYEEGLALAQKCGAEVMWLDADGNQLYSPGFRKLIRT